MARSATALATLISAPPRCLIRLTAASDPCTSPQEDDVELPPYFVDRDIDEPSIDRDARVVHPGIDTTELGDRCVRRGFDLVPIGHVGNASNRAPAVASDGFDRVIEIGSVARNERYARAATGRAFRCDQSDSAGRTRDDDRLLGEWLELSMHEFADFDDPITAVDESGTERLGATVVPGSEFATEHRVLAQSVLVR
jgi:hypothetical protein